MAFWEVIGAISTIALLLSHGVVSQNTVTSGQSALAGPRAAASLSSVGTAPVATPAQTLNIQVYNGYPVTWGTFGRYSGCSAVCGFGVRRRQRACYAYITTSTGQIVIATNAGSPIIASGPTTGVAVPGPIAFPGAIPAAAAQLTGTGPIAGPALSPISQPYPAPIAPGAGRGCVGLVVESQRCNLPPCITVGNWGFWIEWTQCDKPCGRGNQQRTRICIGGSTCGGGLTLESRQCNIQPCKIPSRWGQWSPYNPCPVTCGGGNVRRTRLCIGGTDCYGLNEELAPCGQRPCNLYSWGPWISSTPCSASCGPGTQVRRRLCWNNNVPQPGLTQCGNLPNAFSDTITCFGPDCYSWGPWVDQGPCSNRCGPGTRNRRRSCLKNGVPALGITRCGNLPEGFVISVPCNNPDCYGWGPWVASSACTASCGQGTLTRTRVCLRNNVPIGGPVTNCGNLPGGSSGSIICFAPPCFSLGPWSSLPCSTSCGRGIMRKTRVCLRDGVPLRRVNRCGNVQEPLILNEPCNAPDCFVWGPWIPGPCTASCGPGSRPRTRRCFRNGQLTQGGLGCGNLNGPSSDSVPCTGPPCFAFGPWASGPCNARCGSGILTKTRVCLRDNQPLLRVISCGNLIGPLSVTEQCSAPDCYVWGQWIPGPCNAQCGPGSQPRTRVCLRNNVPVVGASTCGNLLGGFSDSIPCSGPSCFSWGTWSISSCSATCGAGIITKTRVCIRDGQPVPSIKRCGNLVGPFSATESCSSPDCFAWGTWTLGRCSANCGVGSIVRSRVCLRNNVPVVGSISCGNLGGPLSDSISCNGPPCYEWGIWSSTQCSATCGAGTITKSRVCLANGQPDTNYGPGPRRCGQLPGPFQVTEACTGPPCITYNYGIWQAWQGCSATCGSGTEVRVRECVTNTGNKVDRRICEDIGLRVFTDSRPCTRPPCISYSYGIWQTWQGCSVSCGSGTEYRIRACVTNLGDVVDRRICEDIGLSVFRETRGCSRPACITYRFSVWSGWSPCRVPCGEGQQIRTRTCVTNLDREADRSRCSTDEGDFFEEVKCVKEDCPGSWLQWNSWSVCTKPCNTGISTRTRLCSSDKCNGRPEDTQLCNKQECRPEQLTDGTYGAWSQWSSCDKPCGGVQRTTRRCRGTCKDEFLRTRSCEPCVPFAGTGPRLVLTCDYDPSQRRDCGYPGIAYELCDKDRCCYDNSQLDYIWCFYSEEVSETRGTGGGRVVTGGGIVDVVRGGGGGGGISTSSGFTSIVTVNGETTITESETDRRGNTYTSVSVENADGRVNEVLTEGGGRGGGDGAGTYLPWTSCERPCVGSRIRIRLCPAGVDCDPNIQTEDCPCPGDVRPKSGDE